MFEKLADFASRRLDIDVSSIHPDSTFESLGVDSLDLVEILMDLEAEFGVELEPEDENLSTMQELADFVESKLN